ncbi:MAG TPA: hypothetical protein VFH40_11160 [Gemmatimonadales bacterium]|nr:hypothetical protein [Gemmatimonadales bacterium]
MSTPEVESSGTEEGEVRVHRIRRRRSDPLPTARAHPPNLRNWVVYTVLASLIIPLMFEGYLNHKPRHPALPNISETTGVRSLITPAADSLRVVVSWDLTLSTPGGRPDSIHVKVLANSGKDSVVHTRKASIFADTAYFAAPPTGRSVSGHSCVAAHHAGAPLTESCTPWQFVRSESPASVDATLPDTVVIQPSGLQIDPDAGGKCAQWQKAHPGESVWITVNRVAIRECTGPNGKPTVAQFCAFVVTGGQKAKSSQRAANRYCEELFVEWSRGRYS